MSADLTFRPRLRRVLGGTEDYDPVRVGDEDAPVCVRLYANPFTESSRLFYEDVYDEFEIGMLNSESVAFEVRPVAPAMRMWTTAVALDAQRAVDGAREGGERVATADIAEFFHAVRDAAGDEAFLDVVKRACLVADNGLLTYDRLLRFAADLEADIDGEELLSEVERGTYRRRVRHDSEMWIQSVGVAAADDDPTNLTAFVAGEPLAEFSYSGLRSQAISRLELARAEAETTDTENH